MRKLILFLFLVVLLALSKCTEKINNKADIESIKSLGKETKRTFNKSITDISNESVKISIEYVKLGNIKVRSRGSRRSVSDDVWQHYDVTYVLPMHILVRNLGDKSGVIMDCAVKLFAESKLIAEGEFIIPADNAVIKSGDIKVINVDVNINTIDKKLFPSEFIPLSLENILPALRKVKTALEINVIKANGKKEMIKKENIDPITLKFNRYLNI